jgi:hypothetical protein
MITVLNAVQQRRLATLKAELSALKAAMPHLPASEQMEASKRATELALEIYNMVRDR